uniref:LigA n=1 Tax=Parastrongyloides trichosuri TaxID=131310 RepID=A0A0N4ZJH6_PARTI
MLGHNTTGAQIACRPQSPTASMTSHGGISIRSTPPKPSFKAEWIVSHHDLPHPRRRFRPFGQGRPGPRGFQRADGGRKRHRRHPSEGRPADHPSLARGGRQGGAAGPLRSAQGRARAVDEPEACRSTAGAAAARPRALRRRLRGRRGQGRRGRSGRRRRAAAGERPLPQGRGKERPGLRPTAGGARRPLRAGRRAGQAAEAGHRHRRRGQGFDQAGPAEEPGRQAGLSGHRRRHGQHLPVRPERRCRRFAVREGSGRHRPRDHRGSPPPRLRTAAAGRCGGGQGRQAGHRVGRARSGPHRRRRPDPGRRAGNRRPPEPRDGPVQDPDLERPAGRETTHGAHYAATTARPRGGARLRPARLQHQQHGAGPGHHGGRRRRQRPGHHPGLARRPLLRQRCRPGPPDRRPGRVVSAYSGLYAPGPRQRPGHLRHRHPVRLHLGDDGRLAGRRRQDPRLVRVQRRRHAPRHRNGPLVRRLAGRRSPSHERDRRDPQAPAQHPPGDARLLVGAAGPAGHHQPVRRPDASDLGRAGRGNPARHQARRAQDQHRHRQPHGHDRRHPHGVQDPAAVHRPDGQALRRRRTGPAHRLIDAKAGLSLAETIEGRSRRAALFSWRPPAVLNGRCDRHPARARRQIRPDGPPRSGRARRRAAGPRPGRRPARTVTRPHPGAAGGRGHIPERRRDHLAARCSGRTARRSPAPDHPVRGRRPDRHRQGARHGGPSRARLRDRHPGPRPAAPLRRPVDPRRSRPPRHRPPPGQGHLRRHGRRQVGPRPRGAGRAVRRPRHRAHLCRPDARRALAREGPHPDPDRSLQRRPQEDGGAEIRRARGHHRLCRPADVRPPGQGLQRPAGRPRRLHPADRPHPPDPRPHGVQGLAPARRSRLWLRQPFRSRPRRDRRSRPETPGPARRHPRLRPPLSHAHQGRGVHARQAVERTPGYRGRPPSRDLPPAPRGQDRHGLSRLRPADRRGDLRGQRRPDAGGKEIRSRQGLPPGDLRHVVDPRVHSGIHPALLVPREDGHHGGAEEAVLQPAQGQEPDFGLRGRRSAPRSCRTHRHQAGRNPSGRHRHEPPSGRRRLAERAPAFGRRKRVAGLAGRRQRRQSGNRTGRERGKVHPHGPARRSHAGTDRPRKTHPDRASPQGRSRHA